MAFSAFLIVFGWPSGVCLLANGRPLNVRTQPVPPATKPALQVGLAAWYGPGFHGRRTANGEIFDMFDLTAAHRELPLGSLIRVTNLNNRKSVVVRVNDRGPWGAVERIIDLSYAASQRLGMANRGLVRVRLDPVSQTQAPALAARGRNLPPYGRGTVSH